MMQRYRLTDNELMLWLRFIEHQVGFVMPSSQVSWIRGIIERHLTATQMTSTTLLEAISENRQLYHQVFDDILIPRTQFFRHLPTFNFIRDYARHWRQQVASHVTPHLGQTPSLTAWSVGCSTGQETVSMALSLIRELGEDYAFNVYGSDFNQQALAHARQGSYDIAEWAYIPPVYHQWLQLENNKKIQVSARLMQHLTYFSKNLVQYMQPMPLQKRQCQIIVCKNVLIYFRQFEQRDIVKYLSQYLADDGVLLLGAGELPQLNLENLQRVPMTSINAFYTNHPPAWLQNFIVSNNG